MRVQNNLTSEQIQQINRLNFLYSQASENKKTLDDDQLYTRLIRLDESIRSKALLHSFFEGGLGLLFVITGFNLLTHLSHSFLEGILFFSIGAIMLACSLPLYQFLLKRNRKKYAPFVLTITKFWS